MIIKESITNIFNKLQVEFTIPILDSGNQIEGTGGVVPSTRKVISTRVVFKKIRWKVAVNIGFTVRIPPLSYTSVK